MLRLRDWLLPAAPLGFAAPPLIRSFATVGAFASNAILVPRPAADMVKGMRLFVPVRGDPSITYFDVDDDRDGGPQTFRLDCGGFDEDHRCVPFHKVGQ